MAPIAASTFLVSGPNFDCNSAQQNCPKGQVPNAIRSGARVQVLSFSGNSVNAISLSSIFYCRSSSNHDESSRTILPYEIQGSFISNLTIPDDYPRCLPTAGTRSFDDTGSGCSTRPPIWLSCRACAFGKLHFVPIRQVLLTPAYLHQAVSRPSMDCLLMRFQSPTLLCKATC